MSVGKKINLRAKLRSPLRKDIVTAGHDDPIGDQKGSSIVDCFQIAFQVVPLTSQYANRLVQILDVMMEGDGILLVIAGRVVVLRTLASVLNFLVAGRIP